MLFWTQLWAVGGLEHLNKAGWPSTRVGSATFSPPAQARSWASLCHPVTMKWSPRASCRFWSSELRSKQPVILWLYELQFKTFDLGPER